MIFSLSHELFRSIFLKYLTDTILFYIFCVFISNLIILWVQSMVCIIMIYQVNPGLKQYTSLKMNILSKLSSFSLVIHFFLKIFLLILLQLSQLSFSSYMPSIFFHLCLPNFQCPYVLGEGLINFLLLNFVLSNLCFVLKSRKDVYIYSDYRYIYLFL